MKSLFRSQLEDIACETKLRDDLFKIMFVHFIGDDSQDKYKGFQANDEGRIWPDIAAKTWRCVDEIMKER